MTFLQPNKKNSAIINRIIAALIVPAILGVVALIMLHNQFVDIKHDMDEMSQEIENARASAAELKDQIFNFYGSESLENLKNSQGLFQEKNPDYFQTAKQWALAS